MSSASIDETNQMFGEAKCGGESATPSAKPPLQKLHKSPPRKSIRSPPLPSAPSAPHTPPLKKNVHTKGTLPHNVIRTQANSAVSRFGVKLRYNGCPLRIGSAYCTPGDADKVASVFRDCAQVDSKGNIFFAENFEEKYKNVYANRYLPFTTTKNNVQVVKFLSGWLQDWKKKMKKKKNGRRIRGTSTKGKVARKTKATSAKVASSSSSKMKAPSSFSLSKMKACPSSVLGKHPLSSVSAVGVTSGDNKYKQLQQQGTGTNIFAGKGTQEEVEIKINELGGGSSNLNEYNSHNGDLCGMIGMIKAVLRANGLHQKKEEERDGFTMHGWQNRTLEVSFSVKSLLHTSGSTPPFSGVSSRSNSTEEEENNFSSSDSFEVLEENDSSSADSPIFDYFDDIFDGMSDIYIENLVPNSIEKYSTETHDVNRYSLITLNGVWENHILSHGILETVNPDTGIVSEKKAVDILHRSESYGTSSYFAIDLKEFAIGKYKFRLIEKDLLLSQVGESNRVDFEITRPAHYANKNLKVLNSDDSGDSSDNGKNNDGNKNNGNNRENDKNHDGIDDKTIDGKFERYEFSGSHFNNMQKLKKLDVRDADIELGEAASQKKIMPKKLLPLFQSSNQFRNEFIIANSILLVFLFCPNSTRGLTFKTDPHLQGSFSFVEKLGFTDFSIWSCSLFTDEAMCRGEILYLATDNLGSPYMHGPSDYYTRVRDPMPLANTLGKLAALLLPLMSHFLLLSYFTQPYKRDRMSSKCTIFLTVTEMVYYYYEGYSMIFSLGHFVSILLIIGMEEYIHRNWSIGKYAKYRLEYRTFHTVILYLCHLTIRPWVVKHYGKGEITDLPIVTTMFAPLCQRMFAQNLPVLIGVKKGPVSLSWFPYLVFFALVLSLATALSIDSLNAHTIFQLWPYYVSPYFVAFSVATGIKFLRIPMLLRFVLDENSQLPGWHF
jgi:hypothetical protein